MSADRSAATPAAPMQTESQRMRASVEPREDYPSCNHCFGVVAAGGVVDPLSAKWFHDACWVEATQKTVKCPDCCGDGFSLTYQDGPVVCSICRGRGEVSHERAAEYRQWIASTR